MKFGFNATTPSCAQQTYSASAPRFEPNTSLPGRKLVTPRPTLSTVPAKSVPGTTIEPFLDENRLMIRPDPLIANRSAMLIDDARTRTSSPSSGTTGVG